ncbi:MAG TPA: hypothetical protein VFF40_07775 [Acidimicrobiia bacterium]|nr:hypothetical protein [Acidimicrobiia bacterium]
MSDRLQRIGLAVLALTISPTALWAAFSPRSFYSDFPGGGATWVAVDGPYNEHLVRDVGAFSLALLVIAIWALVTLSRPLVRATAAGFLLSGLVHLGYHVRNLQPYDGADQIGVVAGLVVAPVVALLVLGGTMRPSTRSSTPSSTSESTVPRACS